MEVLSQKFVADNLTIEISVHDLSYRMGFAPGVEPQNHIFVNVMAKDVAGTRLWSTPLLSDDGKIKAYSSVAEALTDAKTRIHSRSGLLAG
jgi:hypothetical protein